MNESKFLGRQVEYPQHYSPEILVAVTRELNREEYDINAQNLPFVGVDVWHAYELSFLTKKGLPVSGVMKVIYPCNNPVIVESKSLKLYLNSFNMEQYGETPDEGVRLVEEIIKGDLSKLLNTAIKLTIFTSEPRDTSFDFKNYRLLEEIPEIKNTSFNMFKETPQLLTSDKHEPFSLKIATHLLRSNCKVTFQPDWGSSFIYIKGENRPSQESLLKYLVSFRNENHFHEEVCEMIYKRLWDTFQPDELAVTCIYTRRGGIDITPVRVSHKKLLPTNLTNVNTISKKLLRQ